MKLQRREIILATIAGGLALAMVVWLLFFSGSGLSSQQLAARRDRLAASVEEKELNIKAAAIASKRLAEWQHRALPSNVSDARTVYQAWLRRLADRCELKQLNIDSAGGQSRKDIFTILTFSIRGRTNLAKLVEFLHVFYSSGHLHQIRRVELKPVENAPEMDISFTVEAMSLPGADRKSEMAKEPEPKDQQEKLAEYTKTINERNLLGPFHPAPDAAQTTTVSAILKSKDGAEVWLMDKSSGQQWKLNENDAFQVGSLQGSVKTIDERDVKLTIDKKLRRFRIGENLRGGEEVKEE